MSNKKLSRSEFILLNKLLWKVVLNNNSQREKLQKNGLDVILSNFYSSIPSISEVKNSFEYKETSAPFMNKNIFKKGILLKVLKSLIPLTQEFSPEVEGNEEFCRNFFWKNSQFSYSDAMAYYAFINLIKPSRILEIGSGFSSLIALEALKKLGRGKLICLEPFPRKFITKLSNEKEIELLRMPAQQLNVKMLNSLLNDGDILFIDSTHTIKTGSDCLHIYLRLLPFIKKNIYIHIHDIFLPFGMPKDWLLNSNIYWTEQYLVLAWMIDNSKISVVYSSNYHKKFNSKILDKLMHNQFESGGGSLWLKYNGRLK
jgi:hypothetical protein